MITLDDALSGNPTDLLTMTREKFCRLVAAAHSEGSRAGRANECRSRGERHLLVPDAPLQIMTNPYLGGPIDD